MNKVNNLKRHAKERFYSNIETNLTESANKRDFWKIIRHFVKSNTSSSTIPPLITEENGHRQIHVTDDEKADCLTTYFTSVSTVPDVTPDLPVFHLKTNEKLESFEILELEVYDVLSSLNVNKASGPSFISYKLLKSVARAVSNLKQLFLIVYLKMVFPWMLEVFVCYSYPQKGRWEWSI